MIWGRQNAIKNQSKIKRNFGCIFDGLWSGYYKNNFRELCPRRNALCAWILNLPRIRLHKFRHALLPQRGAADSIEDPLRGEHRRPTFYSRPSRRWFEGERSTFLAFAVGEVFLSSVRTAGSRLVLGGSRQILGWFLARSRPKRAKMAPGWRKRRPDGPRGLQNQ